MVSLASINRATDIVAPSVGGSLKRKTLDSSDTETASSQLKRRRVTFNPTVDVQILLDENEKSLELVGEEVRRALEKHAAGDKAAYDVLKGLFREDARSANAPLSGLLQKYVIALTNHVHLLDHSRKGLVLAVIDCSWTARNDAFVRSYRYFLRSLLSIHSGFMSTVLQMLVAMFLKAPSTTARQADDPPIERVRVQARIHECLRSILRNIPMASAFLAPVLATKFPYPDDDAKTHVHYIRNILRVVEYCPPLKGEVFSLVTDKLVKIDVQIQVDMDELEDDMEERLVGEAVDDDDSSDDESVSSEESIEPDEQRLKDIRQAVSKLDTIMDLLFTHYDAIFAEDRFEADALYQSLLAQFAATILPTYRSRHTQFLLFHFSQTSAVRTEQFAGACSHIAFDQNRPHVLRVTAAAYLGSFIARGAHVSSQTVRGVFDLLCHQLELLRATHEPGCKGPDLRRYGTYYAISQALLYTFCFRWRDLIVTPDGEPPSDYDIIDHADDFRWYNNTQQILHRNILSKLNPLKICAPPIVNQFARMAHHLCFLYVFPLIETNKRVRLARSLASGYLDGIGGRETALSNKRGEDTHLLDAYFPFDPYVLPRSKRWLEQDYVHWRPVPGMPVEKEDSEDEESEGEDDAEYDSESGKEDMDEDLKLDDLDDESTETSI
ncbi:RNA polymerase I-specific transcription initiation factor RRN3 [Paraphoma chrysanthemicola]|uniref:RNA polymerase I-specific transcription initiation factor RRN3 n=1 Tax=Paraphoma chrysanthemicola TaxID=798071 RepID=A0A8K0VSM5_9PLEO|nr:RNA polymerase I-specific transcription initiation factor RRN3 [Paraphoma chrysanthemicola]